MEKSKEVRRSSSTMAASNGVTKRRLRISESSRDVVTGRDRPEKKERDPESLNRTKRRRSERFAPKSERDVKEDSSDECLGDDDVKHSYRRKRRPDGRHVMAFSKVAADEMIGVSVPRKARSACIKRSPNCRPSSGSGGGGFGEDRRRPQASPGSCSFEVVSPSSSTVSVIQQKKNVNGSKSLGTIEDELEIEIAEVLSGLKKQPHCSKREESEAKGDDSSVGVEIGGKARIGTVHSENIDKSTNGGTKTSVDGVLSLVSEASTVVSQLENNVDKSNCSSKLDTDLMVPPTMPSSSPDKASRLPLVSDSIVTQDYCKQVNSIKSKEKTIVDNKMTSDEAKQKQVGNRELLNLDLERPTQETSRDSCLRLQNLNWSQLQQAETAQQSSVLPLTVTVGGWPSGLPPHGYVSINQNGKPVDGSNGSSSTFVQGAPFFATQPRPRRCATHVFIAQNIQLHQHFVKTNHLSQPNKGSVYSKGGESRPAAGSPSLHGSSPILSINSQTQDRIAVISSRHKACESGHFTLTRQRNPQPPPPSSNMAPAQAFIFPSDHHLQPFMVPSKSPCLAKNPRVAAGSSSVNFNHPSSSASETSSPYSTALSNHAYSFQLSPTISGGTPSQALPFINGSFYSPQMFQPAHPLQKPSEAQRETKAASCSSSSHRQQQPHVNINSLSGQANVQKYRQQSQKSEAKATGDDSDSRGSHTQKGGLNGQIITAPMQPQNFSMSFASFPGGSGAANVNFSFNGYHIVSAQQANDSKTGGGSGSSNAQDPKKSLTWKPPAIMNGQTLVFDNPSRTLNFVSGTWPPPATITFKGDHQVFTHHLTQRQQQSSGSKGTTHSQADSVPGTSSQWKIPATSALTLCNSLQFQSQQQVRRQGQTQISFATPSKSQPSHGQQGRYGGSSPSSVTGSAPLGKAANPKANSNKALPLSPVPSSETENSASCSTQKTSPVCGRNVQPIITSYPGHLSELKY